MTHRPRATRCVEVAEIGGWSMKLYTITAGPTLDRATLDAAKAVAAETVGEVAEPGVGFVIVHHGDEGVWLLVDTWHGDIVNQSVFRSDLETPNRFVPVSAGGPTACVHELLVHHHESQSLVRHVLGARVDRERYLNDWLTIHVEGEDQPPPLPPPSVTIRPIARGDEQRWREMWRGYQQYYRLDLPAEVTDTTWERLFDPDEPIHGLVAVADDGSLAGFTHYVPHRSTMSVANRCYLHDLYSDPTVRSTGVGRALVEAVYAAAEAGGHGAVYWLTEHFNGRARRLYDRVGVLTPFIRYNQP